MDSILVKLRQRYAYSLIILKQLIITDFKLRYKGSVLGYVWTLLKPLSLFAVMYIVFVHFLKFGAGVPHFEVQLLLGVVLWNYFSEVTVSSITSIVGKGDLMRKLYFPRYVIVLAGSFSALINLAINLVIVAALIIINGVDISSRAILILPVIVELFAFALALAFLLSALYVKLRDLNYIWELILQVGFYATPIFYPLSMVAKVSEDIAKIMMLNPITQMIQDARYALISPEAPTIWGFFNPHPFLRFVPFIIVALLLLLSVVYFKKQSPSFAEDI